MESMLTVEVRMAISGDEVCALELPATARLAQLRELIAQKDGREVAQQTLISGTTELRGDRKTLRELLPLPEATDSGDSPAEDAVGGGAKIVQVQLIIIPLEDVVKDVREVRKRLSQEDANLQDAIDKGVVEKYGIYLAPCSCATLQFEASWALTNIASGTTEQVRVLIENGLVPHFVELLRSESEDVAEQAVWGLANIAGDCAEFRDEVLRAGALEVLISEYVEQKTRRLTPTAPWALGNMCRGVPPPSLDLLEPLFRNRNLYELLIYDNHEDVVKEFLWACNYIGDYAPHVLIDRLDLAKKLSELCLHESAQVQEPAIGVIMKLASSGESHIQALIDGAFLDAVRSLVAHRTEKIRKEVFLTLEEIIAQSNSQQLQAFLDIDESLKLHELMNGELPDVRRNARKVVAKLMSSPMATSEQIIAMVQRRFLEDLMYVVHHWKEDDGDDDKDVLRSVLDAVCSLIDRMCSEDANSTTYNDVAAVLFTADVGKRLQDIEEEFRDEWEAIYLIWKDAKAKCSAPLPSS